MHFSFKYSVPPLFNKNSSRQHGSLLKCEISRLSLSPYWSCPAVGTTLTVFIVIVAVAFPNVAEGYNDEKGILKWNPYWFTNFRYSAPSSFYMSPSSIGTPYKRLSEPMWGGGGGQSPSSYSSSSGNTGGVGGIYKWSPVYFSGGSAPPTPSYYAGGGAGSDSGYMYSSNRPRWSLSDYGGSRFLTRYYGGNSYAPRITKDSGGIDLAGGSNDLSALLGEEMMNNGLGLENDVVDVLSGDEGLGISDKKSR